MTILATGFIPPAM